MCFWTQLVETGGCPSYFSAPRARVAPAQLNPQLIYGWLTDGPGTPTASTVLERGSMTPLETPDPSDRLAYDAELCARFRACDCQGKEWDVFVAKIYQRAVKITYRWITQGLIFQICRKLGRSVDSGDIFEWPESDIRALAHDTVAENIKLFTNIGIRGGGWDSQSGAGLFTYFMNGVALTFPNVFRRKRTERSRWQRLVDLRGDPETLDQIEFSGYETSLSYCADLLRMLLDSIRFPRQRQAAEMYFAEGFSYNQIAHRLNITSAAARSLVNRARREMRSSYTNQEGGRL